MKVVFLFLAAGILEIGGGFLIWLWLKHEKSFYFGITGAVLLVLYGVVATYQPENFAKTYATYGGIFIFLSLLNAYLFDNYSPGKNEIIGMLLVLAGVLIIYFSPGK